LKAAKPQLLLKAVLAHGAQGVVKDVLLEDLWPEADPEGAERNFKVNLHRLRKALEPDLDKTFGSSYLHLKANLVSLDAELCDLDVEKLLALAKEGERKEAQGQVGEAVGLFKEAVASYGGDFLREELYFPWATAKREKLRETYRELLHHLGDLYEKQGALTRAIDCYKKLVRFEPLDEPACQRLMLLLRPEGHAQRRPQSLSGLLPGP
jgi:LuxR family transcriptional regulator, maltose regulon positive regulatory protein